MENSSRVVVVTGANCGIGFEVSKILCQQSYDVILACRSEEKAYAAIEKIKAEVPNAMATFMKLDLASFESIRKFVKDFQATGKKLHVLVNNAGVCMNRNDTKRYFTENNLELTMGVNHFGHFLLTNLLLDDLRATGSINDDARVVVLSSGLHDAGKEDWRGQLQPLDLDDPLMEKDGAYSAEQAYKNSKAANIMFTYALARKLDGAGVTVNAMCPGFIPGTDILRHASFWIRFFARYIMQGLLWPLFRGFMRTVQQGGQAVVDLITKPELKGVTGRYFKDGKEMTSSEETRDEDKQMRLWDISAKYVGLEG